MEAEASVCAVVFVCCGLCVKRGQRCMHSSTAQPECAMNEPCADGAVCAGAQNTRGCRDERSKAASVGCRGREALWVLQRVNAHSLTDEEFEQQNTRKRENWGFVCLDEKNAMENTKKKKKEKKET